MFRERQALRVPLVLLVRQALAALPVRLALLALPDPLVRQALAALLVRLDPPAHRAYRFLIRPPHRLPLRHHRESSPIRAPSVSLPIRVQEMGLA